MPKIIESLCERWVHRLGYPSSRCGKDFVENIEGEDLCKFHASHARRKKKRNDDYRREQAEYQRNLAGWERRMKAAAKRLGVKAQLDSVAYYRTDSVVISLEDFERLSEHECQK